jgi:hypothetical protein
MEAATAVSEGIIEQPTDGSECSYRIEAATAVSEGIIDTAY